MIRQFSSSLILLSGLLATTAMSPASAQAPATSRPDGGAQAAPQAPAASSPPSSVGGVASTPAKSEADTAKSNQDSSHASDRIAFFEADLAALHAGLMLTSDQEKLWPATEQSIRTMASIRADTRQAVKDVFEPQDDKGENNRSRDGSDPSLATDPFLAIKATSVLLLERGKALEALADASGPLYASLSSEQKGRLPVLVRSLAPDNVRLRHFVALLTWDATAEKREGLKTRNDQAKRRQDGQGSWGSEESDRRRDEGAMGRDSYQGWSGRQHADRDGGREADEPGQMSGRLGSRRGYGMRRGERYSDLPYGRED